MAFFAGTSSAAAASSAARFAAFFAFFAAFSSSGGGAAAAAASAAFFAFFAAFLAALSSSGTSASAFTFFSFFSFFSFLISDSTFSSFFSFLAFFSSLSLPILASHEGVSEAGSTCACMCVWRVRACWSRVRWRVRQDGNVPTAALDRRRACVRTARLERRERLDGRVIYRHRLAMYAGAGVFPIAGVKRATHTGTDVCRDETLI